MRSTRLPWFAVVLLAAAVALFSGCTNEDGPQSPSSSSTSPSGATEPVTPTPDANRTPEPALTAAPTPSETKNYYGEALALSAGGGRTLVVRYDGTSLDPVFVDAKRAFSVYLTLENRGDEPVRGNLARAVITDELGNRFRPQARPLPAQLNANAPDYGHANRNLTKSVTVSPDQRVQGVLVFEILGGPRVIQLKISLAPGEPPGVWETNFGVL